MFKISNTFFKNINITSSIEPIPFTEVKEFQIRKKFFYSLTNEKILSYQKDLVTQLQKAIEINNAATAYRKGYSYFHFLLPHKSNYLFTRLDIRSFFHSIKEEDIRFIFKQHFFNHTLKESEQNILDTFINITMLDLPLTSTNNYYKNKKILPMGFITSPVISNIVFRPIDIQIQKFCKQFNITYTRYADDMLFSSKNIDSEFVFSSFFIDEIQKILSQNNFSLNSNKEIKKRHTLSLNGYVISNGEIRFSNKKIKIIYDLIYMYGQYKKGKYSAFYILQKLFKYTLPFTHPPKGKTLDEFYEDQLLNKFTGYRSFLISIIKFNQKYNIFQPKMHTKSQSTTIDKYKELLHQIEEIIEKWDN